MHRDAPRQIDAPLVHEPAHPDARAARHFLGSPQANDGALRAAHVDRVYDTFVNEDEFMVSAGADYVTVHADATLVLPLLATALAASARDLLAARRPPQFELDGPVMAVDGVALPASA